MPIIVTHYPDGKPEQGETYEFDTPYEAATHLLQECSVADLERLQLTDLCRIKRTVAKFEALEAAEVGGEGGGA